MAVWKRQEQKNGKGERKAPVPAGKHLRIIGIVLLSAAVLIVCLAVWGPEALARYRDRTILNQIQTKETEKGAEGYRYSLSGSEKVSILSKCLDSRIQPESEQNALARTATAAPEITGAYAFVLNTRETSGRGTPAASGIELCNQGIGELKQLGILPEEVGELEEDSCHAVLYSAIDVSEPRNSVLVWNINRDTAWRNTDMECSLLDVYVDADIGKIYEFYARTAISSWEEVDPDRIVAAWAAYMGLEEPQEYDNANPLAENTPYFKKYGFAGMEDDTTIVTIGFYEGINELYLKISR